MTRKQSMLTVALLVTVAIGAAIGIARTTRDRRLWRKAMDGGIYTGTAKADVYRVLGLPSGCGGDAPTFDVEFCGKAFWDHADYWIKGRELIAFNYDAEGRVETMTCEPDPAETLYVRFRCWLGLDP